MKYVNGIVVILILCLMSVAHAGEDDKPPVATDLKLGTKIFLKRNLNLLKCGADMFVNLGTGECTPNQDNIITGRKCVIGPIVGDATHPATASDNILKKGSPIEVTSVKVEDNSFITIGYKSGTLNGTFTCARDFIDLRQTTIPLKSFKYNIREYFQVDDPSPLVQALTGSLPKVTDHEVKHSDQRAVGDTNANSSKPAASTGL